MDKKTLVNILVDAKHRLKNENDIFIRALDKRIDDETKFRLAIDRLTSMTTSAIDVLKLGEELNSDHNDAEIILNAKKNLTSIANFGMELRKEANLSRKRSHQLIDASKALKHMFDIESSAIVEIPDSPSRLSDESDESNIQQITKVKCFVFCSIKK